MKSRTAAQLRSSVDQGLVRARLPATERMALAMQGQLHVYFRRGGEHDDPNGRSGD